MTTETAPSAPSRKARPYGAAALGAAVLASSAAGVLVAVLGAVFDGSAGLIGGLAGAGVVLLVLASGFALVDLVSSLMPSLSMIFALMTYSFQVLLLAGLLTVLRSADDIDDTLTPAWFAGGVIAVALAWTVCLVWHALHARVPLYDLPANSPVNASVAVAGAQTDAGER